MKTVSWTAFKRYPNAVFKGGTRIRVNRGDGTYFVVTRYSDFKNDIGFRRPQGKPTRKRCDLCGKLNGARFTVPFDMSFPPAYYCAKCRRANDIMDVKEAKRYGKLF